MWVVEHMRHSFHSELVIGTVHSHCLLGHSTLQGILGGLVMVGERND